VGIDLEFLAHRSEKTAVTFSANVPYIFLNQNVNRISRFFSHPE
jgi:hypothetical protein